VVARQRREPNHGGQRRRVHPLFHRFLVAGLLRAWFPYPLEIMEDANVQVVRHVLSGETPYAAATPTYIPTLYGPIYFYLSALVALIVGPTLIALRLVSLIASIGAAILIVAMVTREVQQPIFGVIGAAVFVGSTQLSYTSLDLGRVDALGVFFIMGALYAMRSVDFAPRRAELAAALSGLLAGLAILTKQTNNLLALHLATGYWSTVRGEPGHHCIADRRVVMGGLGYQVRITPYNAMPAPPSAA
jgi:hypothetical protein